MSRLGLFTALAVLLSLSVAVLAQDAAPAEGFEIKGRVMLNFRGNATHPEGSPAVSSPQEQKEVFRQMRIVLKGSTEMMRTCLVRQDGTFSLYVSH